MECQHHKFGSNPDNSLDIILDCLTATALMDRFDEITSLYDLFGDQALIEVETNVGVAAISNPHLFTDVAFGNLHGFNFSFGISFERRQVTDMDVRAVGTFSYRKENHCRNFDNFAKIAGSRYEAGEIPGHYGGKSFIIRSPRHIYLLSLSEDSFIGSLTALLDFGLYSFRTRRSRKWVFLSKALILSNECLRDLGSVMLLSGKLFQVQLFEANILDSGKRKKVPATRRIATCILMALGIASLNASLLGPACAAGQIVQTVEGCDVWIPIDVSHPIALWSGACVAGKGEGVGAIEIILSPSRRIKFEGNLTSGQWSGFGKITVSNGDTLSAFRNSGEIIGPVVQTLTDGSSYSGGWGPNGREGFGTLLSPGGRTYEGQWHNGKRSGFGRQTVGGGTLLGNWLDGKQVGQSIIIGEDGRSASVQWKEGRAVGKAIFKSPAGDIYFGEFDTEEYTRHGMGIALWGDGSMYKGEWKGNLPNGIGQFFRGGEQFTGVWQDGCLRIDGSVLRVPIESVNCPETSK